MDLLGHKSPSKAGHMHGHSYGGAGQLAIPHAGREPFSRESGQMGSAIPNSGSSMMRQIKKSNRKISNSYVKKLPPVAAIPSGI
mgnify:CR=1 FL=1|jgi:hypothetical protein